MFGTGRVAKEAMMLLLRKACAAQCRPQTVVPKKLCCHCGNESTRQGLQLLTCAGSAGMLAEAAILVGTGSPATAAPLLSSAVPCA